MLLQQRADTAASTLPRGPPRRPRKRDVDPAEPIEWPAEVRLRSWAARVASQRAYGGAVSRGYRNTCDEFGQSMAEPLGRGSCGQGQGPGPAEHASPT
ncbi:MAG: hypothetical protein LBE67_09555 [Kocuria palustris]|nr:hypothetical protein [Kocuria palustris]